jgi:hypothetical protein
MPIRRIASAGSSELSVRYSNFDPTSSRIDEGTVPGTVSLGPGNRNVDPGFAAPGDFHLRGDSKLIDVGETTIRSAETDLGGLDRSADGDADLASEVDLGAYEYQRTDPVADFSVGPAVAGAPVACDASPSSDPDPGDESGFTYSWSFGDGSSQSGLAPEHVYVAPGEYTVTLNVTDPGGKTAATTRIVSVGPGPAGGGGDGSGAPAGSGVSNADLIAPVISGLRITRRGRIRFRLSEPARVTLRFKSARSGKRKALLKLHAVAGLNTVRLRQRALRPGAYRLTMVAKDAAGNAARARGPASPFATSVDDFRTVRRSLMGDGNHVKGDRCKKT